MFAKCRNGMLDIGCDFGTSSPCSEKTLVPVCLLILIFSIPIEFPPENCTVLGMVSIDFKITF